MDTQDAITRCESKLEQSNKRLELIESRLLDHSTTERAKRQLRRQRIGEMQVNEQIRESIKHWESHGPATRQSAIEPAQLAARKKLADPSRYPGMTTDEAMAVLERKKTWVSQNVRKLRTGLLSTAHIKELLQESDD